MTRHDGNDQRCWTRDSAPSWPAFSTHNLLLFSRVIVAKLLGSFVFDLLIQETLAKLAL